MGGQDARAARRRHRLAGLEGRAHRRPRPSDGEDAPWAHPNSRFTTTLANVPNVAADFEDPKGVPIDAIIFGGRTRDREPLIRAITDLAEGVYDGLTLGAEATFAAEGIEGMLRYDPMSMRPFMSYSEGAYAAHWLKIIGEATEQPIFAHVNWFQRDPEDGHFLWPGYRDNLRAAALADAAQERRGHRPADARSASSRPGRSSTSRASTSTPEDLDTILTIDIDRWRQEMAQPRGAPGPVRRPARGDLGGAPPGRRRARRRGLSCGRRAVGEPVEVWFNPSCSKCRIAREQLGRGRRRVPPAPLPRRPADRGRAADGAGRARPPAVGHHPDVGATGR